MMTALRIADTLTLLVILVGTCMLVALLF